MKIEESRENHENNAAYLMNTIDASFARNYQILYRDYNKKRMFEVHKIAYNDAENPRMTINQLNEDNCFFTNVLICTRRNDDV